MASSGARAPQGRPPAAVMSRPPDQLRMTDGPRDVRPPFEEDLARALPAHRREVRPYVMLLRDGARRHEVISRESPVVTFRRGGREPSVEDGTDGLSTAP